MSVNEILRKHNISLDTDRSQHFLTNELMVDRMVEEAEIAPNDTVLEIGAGIGTITKELAEKAGKVIAYENDGRLISALKEELSGYDNVEIRREDFMDTVEAIEEADGDEEEAILEFDKCVANIPFHLSSEIVEFLGKQQKLSILLLQRTFARKLTAEPGSSTYSRTTVMTNYYMVPVYLEHVYDINFTPEPDTDAALIKLFPNKDRYDVEDEEQFFEDVKALFVHQKKKVRNAFYDSRHMFDLDKDEARDIQDELPHADERVFNLDIRQLVEVSNELKELQG